MLSSIVTMVRIFLTVKSPAEGFLGMKVLSVFFFFPIATHIAPYSYASSTVKRKISIYICIYIYIYIYIHKLIIVYPCGIVLDAFVERGISEG